MNRSNREVIEMTSNGDHNDANANDHPTHLRTHIPHRRSSSPLRKLKSFGSRVFPYMRSEISNAELRFSSYGAANEGIIAQSAARHDAGRKCEAHRGRLISSDSETASSAVQTQQSRHSLDGERNELTSRDEASHASNQDMDVEDAEGALDPRIQVISSQILRFLRFQVATSGSFDLRAFRLTLCCLARDAAPNTAWYIVPLCFHFPSFAPTDLARCARL